MIDISMNVVGVQDVGSGGPAVTFDFSGSSALDGADGNIRTFASGGVSVNASAFSRDTSGAWSTAWLGSYGGGRSQGLFKRAYAFAPDATGVIGVPIPVWTTRGFVASWDVPPPPGRLLWSSPESTPGRGAPAKEAPSQSSSSTGS